MSKTGEELKQQFNNMEIQELEKTQADLATYALECDAQIKELEQKLQEMKALRGQAWREHGYAATAFVQRKGGS